MNKKRLATHCIPFKKQLPRDNGHIESKIGIADDFILTEDELPFKKNKYIFSKI